MNEENSPAVNHNSNKSKRYEKKDIRNEKINYKIIKNYHKIFLKEKVFI